jgi:hypothetical protein
MLAALFPALEDAAGSSLIADLTMCGRVAAASLACE